MADHPIYRSHLTVTAEGRATAPDYDDALHFFQSVQRRDAVLAIPALAQFWKWWGERRREDAKNSALHGNTRGVIHHIKAVHNWLDEHTDNVPEHDDDEQASSSLATGSLVDSELQQLHRGAIVAAPDAYTVWLVIYLAHRRWLPLAFQVPIWSANGAVVRTSADFIVYDLVAQRFVLVEQKTGYDRHYDFVFRERGEADYLAKTPRTLCHLQAGWMHCQMLQTGHPTPLDACVLRVSDRRGVRQPEPVMFDVVRYYNFEFGMELPLPEATYEDDSASGDSGDEEVDGDEEPAYFDE